MEEIKQEDKLQTLYDSYIGFLAHRDAEWTQKMFNAFYSYTGHSMGSWSCGGCSRRTREKTEYILSQAGLIDKIPSKFINKGGR